MRSGLHPSDSGGLTLTPGPRIPSRHRRVLGDELRPQHGAFVVDGPDLAPVFEQQLALVAFHPGHRPATVAPVRSDSRTCRSMLPHSGPSSFVAASASRSRAPGAGRLSLSATGHAALRARRSVFRLFLPFSSDLRSQSFPVTFHRRTACHLPSGIQQPTPVDPNGGRAGLAAEFRLGWLWQAVRRWNPIPRVFPRPQQVDSVLDSRCGGRDASDLAALQQ